MRRIRTHRDLRVWHETLVLAEIVYRSSAQLPDREKYGLVSQMRRAAVSILSNIAEGAARDSSREFARYLAMARGSLAELDAQVTLAERLRLLEPTPELCKQIESTGQMLSALHRAIRGKRQSAPNRG